MYNFNAVCCGCFRRRCNCCCCHRQNYCPCHQRVAVATNVASENQSNDSSVDEESMERIKSTVANKLKQLRERNESTRNSDNSKTSVSVTSKSSPVSSGTTRESSRSREQQPSETPRAKAKSSTDAISRQVDKRKDSKTGSIKSTILQKAVATNVASENQSNDSSVDEESIKSTVANKLKQLRERNESTRNSDNSKTSVSVTSKSSPVSSGTTRESSRSREQQPSETPRAKAKSSTDVISRQVDKRKDSKTGSIKSTILQKVKPCTCSSTTLTDSSDQQRDDIKPCKPKCIRKSCLTQCIKSTPKFKSTYNSPKHNVESSKITTKAFSLSQPWTEEQKEFLSTIMSCSCSRPFDSNTKILHANLYQNQVKKPQLKNIKSDIKPKVETLTTEKALKKLKPKSKSKNQLHRNTSAPLTVAKQESVENKDIWFECNVPIRVSIPTSICLGAPWDLMQSSMNLGASLSNTLSDSNSNKCLVKAGGNSNKSLDKAGRNLILSKTKAALPGPAQKLCITVRPMGHGPSVLPPEMQQTVSKKKGSKRKKVSPNFRCCPCCTHAAQAGQSNYNSQNTCKDSFCKCDHNMKQLDGNMLSTNSPCATYPMMNSNELLQPRTFSKSSGSFENSRPKEKVSSCNAFKQLCDNMPIRSNATCSTEMIGHETPSGLDMNSRSQQHSWNTTNQSKFGYINSSARETRTDRPIDANSRCKQKIPIWGMETIRNQIPLNSAAPSSFFNDSRNTCKQTASKPERHSLGEVGVDCSSKRPNRTERPFEVNLKSANTNLIPNAAASLVALSPNKMSSENGAMNTHKKPNTNDAMKSKKIIKHSTPPNMAESLRSSSPIILSLNHTSNTNKQGHFNSQRSIKEPLGKYSQYRKQSVVPPPTKNISSASSAMNYKKIIGQKTTPRSTASLGAAQPNRKSTQNASWFGSPPTRENRTFRPFIANLRCGHKKGANNQLTMPISRINSNMPNQQRQNTRSEMMPQTSRGIPSSQLESMSKTVALPVKSALRSPIQQLPAVPMRYSCQDSILSLQNNTDINEESLKAALQNSVYGNGVFAGVRKQLECEFSQGFPKTANNLNESELQQSTSPLRNNSPNESADKSTYVRAYYLNNGISSPLPMQSRRPEESTECQSKPAETEGLQDLLASLHLPGISNNIYASNLQSTDIDSDRLDFANYITKKTSDITCSEADTSTVPKLNGNDSQLSERVRELPLPPTLLHINNNSQKSNQSSEVPKKICSEESSNRKSSLSMTQSILQLIIEANERRDINKTDKTLHQSDQPETKIPKAPSKVQKYTDKENRNKTINIANGSALKQGTFRSCTEAQGKNKAQLKHNPVNNRLRPQDLKLCLLRQGNSDSAPLLEEYDVTAFTRNVSRHPYQKGGNDLDIKEYCRHGLRSLTDKNIDGVLADLKNFCHRRPSSRSGSRKPVVLVPFRLDSNHNKRMVAVCQPDEWRELKMQLPHVPAGICRESNDRPEQHCSDIPDRCTEPTSPAPETADSPVSSNQRNKVRSVRSKAVSKASLRRRVGAKQSRSRKPRRSQSKGSKGSVRIREKVEYKPSMRLSGNPNRSEAPKASLSSIDSRPSTFSSKFEPKIPLRRNYISNPSIYSQRGNWARPIVASELRRRIYKSTCTCCRDKSIPNFYPSKSCKTHCKCYNNANYSSTRDKTASSLSKFKQQPKYFAAPKTSYERQPSRSPINRPGTKKSMNKDSEFNESIWCECSKIESNETLKENESSNRMVSPNRRPPRPDTEQSCGSYNNPKESVYCKCYRVKCKESLPVRDLSNRSKSVKKFGFPAAASQTYRSHIHPTESEVSKWGNCSGIDSPQSKNISRRSSKNHSRVESKNMSRRSSKNCSRLESRESFESNDIPPKESLPRSLASVYSAPSSDTVKTTCSSSFGLHNKDFVMLLKPRKLRSSSTDIGKTEETQCRRKKTPTVSGQSLAKLPNVSIQQQQQILREKQQMYLLKLRQLSEAQMQLQVIAELQELQIPQKGERCTEFLQNIQEQQQQKQQQSQTQQQQKQQQSKAQQPEEQTLRKRNCFHKVMQNPHQQEDCYPQQKQQQQHHQQQQHQSETHQNLQQSQSQQKLQQQQKEYCHQTHQQQQLETQLKTQQQQHNQELFHQQQQEYYHQQQRQLQTLQCQQHVQQQVYQGCNCRARMLQKHQEQQQHQQQHQQQGQKYVRTEDYPDNWSNQTSEPQSLENFRTTRATATSQAAMPSATPAIMMMGNPQENNLQFYSRNDPCSCIQNEGLIPADFYMQTLTKYGVERMPSDCLPPCYPDT